MGLPALVAVDDDVAALRDLERELRDRYERHYRVTALSSPEAANACLEDLAVNPAKIDDDLVIVGAGPAGRRQPSTAPRRASACWSSTKTGSEVRRPPA